VASGASLAALGAGRMLAELVVVCWIAVCFTGTWMCFAHAGHWWNWLAVVAGTSFAASGVGHFASALLASPTLAATLVQVLMIVTSVLSGVNPRLAQVVPLPVLNWPWYLSLATWTAQGAYATWSEPQRGVRDVDAGAAYFGYSVRGVGPAVGALFAIGLLWRAVALAVLAARVDGGALKAHAKAWLACGRRGATTPLPPMGPPESEADVVRVESPRAERVRRASLLPPLA
jgi:hypothetical protein